MSNYSARKLEVDGVAVVELQDAAHDAQVSIAPGIGNMAFGMKSRGKDILWFPYKSPLQLKQTPQFCGIPFLGPWANRLDDDAYWVNGKKYVLSPALGNVRRDSHMKPIHGLLNFSTAWTQAAVEADDHSAFATSRLEFWRHPEMMAQFPFAHTITMTHRLRDGELEVETSIENLATEPLPVAIGYHPYFRLEGAPRDDWNVHIAARDHMVLNDLLIPTGEAQSLGQVPDSHLHGSQLDDVFGNLIRDPDGRARCWVEANGQRITVTYGPKYTVAVVYAPAGRDFICFEPMAALTNGFNLAHAGKYKELQSIPAGETWRESFWVGSKS
jgi:aldose 1-epimerase